MDEDKVVCRTPTPGRKPTRIDRWKYDAVRGAILAAVHTEGEGVLFQDLPLLVARGLSEDEKERLGSVTWYTTTVKLDLETRGELQRVQGASPQRLLRG